MELPDTQAFRIACVGVLILLDECVCVCVCVSFRLRGVSIGYLALFSASIRVQSLMMKLLAAQGSLESCLFSAGSEGPLAA